MKTERITSVVAVRGWRKRSTVSVYSYLSEHYIHRAATGSFRDSVCEAQVVLVFTA